MKNLQFYHFEEIIRKGYSLDMIFLLITLRNKIDISEACNESKKIGALYDSLTRKHLYNQQTKKITVEGDALLVFINSETPSKLIKKLVVKNTDFDTWWEIFPSNNKFIYSGFIFQATRAFKVKKEDCRKLFEKLINSKRFTAKEIIEATKCDIQIKKNNSIKKRENQLTYLQNTYTYLYQQTFEGFINLINDNASEGTIKGSTDV